ncbi:MAG: sigma 54-interacting transcriptional regulator [Candidatus Acidiferrales bacterium]|jgi:DNA-binding NtrC family response regulator
MSVHDPTADVLSEPAPAIKPDGFVASVDPVMQSLERVASDIAATNISVLLIGESGVGKEAHARHVHRLSGYPAENFQKIQCASLNEARFADVLAEAVDDTEISPAGSRTLFFDEVSELDPPCQKMLLSSLPDDEETPGPGVLSARLISATAVDLEAEVQEGRFRKELFYRLNAVCLRLPPLRERKLDIPGLVNHFLDKQSSLLHRPRPSLSARTMKRLADHAWPGNVRELENMVKRMVVLGDDEFALADLAHAGVLQVSAARALELDGTSLKAASRAASREAERTLILKTLERTRWNRKLAAQHLHISYKSLLCKIKLFEELGKVAD